MNMLQIPLKDESDLHTVHVAATVDFDSNSTQMSKRTSHVQLDQQVSVFDIN